jgi:signal transduction histidine kinase/ActR/RegA family two-component response regulator
LNADDARHSFRGKLMRVVLITTAAAVLVAGIAMLTRDLTIYRQSWATDIANQASVVALAVAPALEFDDHETAEQYLDALRARPRILLAALYDAHGSLYAAYVRDGVPQPPPRPPEIRRVNISGERVELVQPVVRGTETLGTLYLLGRYEIASRVYTYLGIFGLVMVLSLLIAYALSKRLQKVITEPLEAMSIVAREIVDRRDYSLRARKFADDEFGLVVDAFNNMLQEVQVRALAQEQTNQKLQQEIEVREAAEEAMREADRRKDEFLATLAHELRNPLAPIRHAVKLLESSNTAKQQQQWAREVISRQMQRMALMLDDLLEVSRITRGRLDLKPQVVSLDSLVNTAVETARPLIDSKQQHLSVSLPGDPVNLRVDPLRLSQSISNLLTNAAKYTDTGGNIALRVTLPGEAIIISVKDDGIGLESAAIPKLFQMFSQVDSAIDRAQGGLGIGLALVKGLIELHAGTVEVSSGGIGHGSEFIIRLPGTLLVADAVPEGAVATDEPALGPTRRNVLVADDNRDAADTLSLLLEMSGYAVTVAHSGQEALKQLLMQPPDAAILDIGMPDMSGYEVARRFRQESGRADVFLLAVTGWGQQDDIARAKEAGFDEHLTKPVDPDRVDQMLREYLSAPKRHADIAKS